MYTDKMPDDLVTLEKADVEKLIEEFCYHKMESSWKSPRTANTALFSLKTFFKVNGFRGNRKLEIDCFHQSVRERIKPQYIPTLDEAQRMADVAGSLRNRAIILFLCSAGLRNSTLRALQYGAVKEELEKGVTNLLIRVHKGMKKVVNTACKGNTEYVVFTSREATEALKLYLSDRRNRLGELHDNNVLFCAEYNRVPRKERATKPISSRELQLIVKEAARKAGLKEWKDVFPHCLRKTFDSVSRTCFADGERLDVKTQEFFIGHILGGSMDTYFDKTKIEDLRKEYAKLIFRPQEQTYAEALSSLQSIAVTMGIDYSGFEESKKKEFGRMLSDKEKLNVIQEAFKRTAEVLKNVNGFQSDTSAISLPKLVENSSNTQSLADKNRVTTEDKGSAEKTVENYKHQDEPLELPCRLLIQSPILPLNGSQIYFCVDLVPYVVDFPGGRSLSKGFYSVEAMGSYINAGAEIIDISEGNGSRKNAEKDFVNSLPSTLNKMEVFRLKWTIDDVRFNDAAYDLLKSQGILRGTATKTDEFGWLSVIHR